MINNLEDDLNKIYINMAKDKHYMVDWYWKESKEKVENAPEKEFTNKAKERMTTIFVMFVAGVKKNLNRICEGKKCSLSNEDLNKLETNFQEILENADFVEILENADFVSDTKEGIKFAREISETILRDFANIYDEFNAFDKENFSWSEVQKLYDKAEKRATAQSGRWAEVAQNRKLCFQSEVIFSAIEMVELINKGDDKIPSNAYPSTAEELKFFQKLTDEFPKILDFSLKTLDEEDEKDDKETKIQEIKAKNEELKTFIQQQRKKLGSSSTNQPKKPNPQDQQKLQTQQKEIELLKKQLAELQNQIEELKKNQTTTDQIANPEINQKIENLQEKKQEIQTELKQKQSSQKELKDKVNAQINSPSSDNKFNWLYVVIPGGILLVIAGIVIAYLLGKKNKRE